MEQDLDPRKGTARGGLFPLPFHLPFDFLKNHPHIILIEIGTPTDCDFIVKLLVPEAVMLCSFFGDESELLQLSQASLSGIHIIPSISVWIIHNGCVFVKSFTYFLCIFDCRYHSILYFCFYISTMFFMLSMLRGSIN